MGSTLNTSEGRFSRRALSQLDTILIPLVTSSEISLRPGTSSCINWCWSVPRQLELRSCQTLLVTNYCLQRAHLTSCWRTLVCEMLGFEGGNHWGPVDWACVAWSCKHVWKNPSILPVVVSWLHHPRPGWWFPEKTGCSQLVWHTRVIERKTTGGCGKGYPTSSLLQVSKTTAKYNAELSNKQYFLICEGLLSPKENCKCSFHS